MGNTRVYGANLRALAVYLLIVRHVPVERCVRLIADLVGAVVSAGFVHKILAAVAVAVAEVVNLIKTLITMAAVVHFDKTTQRSGVADALPVAVLRRGVRGHAGHHLGDPVSPVLHLAIRAIRRPPR